MWGTLLAAGALLVTSLPTAAADEGDETPVTVVPYELPAGMCRPVTVDDVLEAEAAITNPDPALDIVVPATDCDPFSYAMVFPVQGWSWMASPFGAHRDGGARRHEGVDVMAPKMARVVAVADGVVAWIEDGSSSSRCCSIQITHEDGWHSLYLHLNNDTSGTDDGLGTGIAFGLREGDEVLAGQVIGYVGDSGNAEPTPAHLHFELHRPDGMAVDAAASLTAALGELPAEQRAPGGSTLFGSSPVGAASGAFRDDDALPAARWIDVLASRGLVAACDEAGAEFCPGATMTGSDVLRWLGRALPGADDLAIDYGVDPNAIGPMVEDSWSSGSDPRDAHACGSRRLCVDETITVGEALALVAEAFALEPVRRTPLHEDRRSPFAEAIRAAVNGGVVDLCDAPSATTLRPHRAATRAWFASVLARALTEPAPQECPGVE